MHKMREQQRLQQKAAAIEAQRRQAELNATVGEARCQSGWQVSFEAVVCHATPTSQTSTLRTAPFIPCTHIDPRILHYMCCQPSLLFSAPAYLCRGH